MRQQVIDLIKLGPLPDESADEEEIQRHEEHLHRISPPLSDDEARELIKLFGADDCYGLAWTLLHLIETAPGWPIQECLTSQDNEWVLLLKGRWDNKKRLL